MTFVVCQFGLGYINVLWGQNVFEKGYAAATRALSKVPVVYRMGLFEVVLPHDANTSEQSDGIVKIDKFRSEMKKQGFANVEVRPMLRSTDKYMDIGVTTEIIPYMRIHSADGVDVVDALRGHKKKYLKKERIFVQEPSKTKYRDLADACRIMAVDYKYDTYTKAQNIQGGGWFDPTLGIPVPGALGTRVGAGDVGYHPEEGSVIVNSVAGGIPPVSTGVKWEI